MTSHIAGHLGQDKTYHSLCRWFYWPGMYTDAVAYVKAVPTVKSTSHPPRHPLDWHNLCPFLKHLGNR